MGKNLNELIDELIQEVEQELEEATTTASVDGYNTPFAFGAGRKKDKKKEKETATQAGYTIAEAKVKRPVNRWLELKNDETMHPHKKMAMGLKELKYQLREVEKFFNWYNKIKTMNELDSQQYWKRTNNHIYKIKERLINIAKTIQEIEK
jgi:hypothetical protein